MIRAASAIVVELGVHLGLASVVEHAAHGDPQLLEGLEAQLGTQLESPAVDGAVVGDVVDPVVARERVPPQRELGLRGRLLEVLLLRRSRCSRQEPDCGVQETAPQAVTRVSAS